MYLRLSSQLRDINPYSDIYVGLLESVQDKELFIDDPVVVSEIDKKIDEYIDELRRLKSNGYVDDYDGAYIEVVGKSIENSQKLLSMYSQSLKKDGYNVSTDGAIISVYGANVYSKIKSESGIHRFEDKKEDIKVFVYPIINIKVNVLDSDIRIDYYHSSGAGGQNINKVETAIRITHTPTGIVVNCQDERSQKQNKERAFEMLNEKLAKKAISDDRERIDKEKKRLSKDMGIVRVYNISKNTAHDNKNNKDYDLVKLFSGNFGIILSDAII